MTTKKHLEITLDLWHAAITELEQMQVFLNVDQINDQFYRRLLLRTTFSIIETYISVTKELIKNKLAIDKDSIQIQWSDLAALNEKKVRLDAPNVGASIRL